MCNMVLVSQPQSPFYLAGQYDAVSCLENSKIDEIQQWVDEHISIGLYLGPAAGASSYISTWKGRRLLGHDSTSSKFIVSSMLTAVTSVGGRLDYSFIPNTRHA